MSRRSPTALRLYPVCPMCDSTSSCASSTARSASPSRWIATFLDAFCSTRPKELRQGTGSAAPARWYAFRWDQPCSAASSIRWAAHLTVADKSMPKATNRWSVPPPQSSIAISSANRYRPGLLVLDSMFALGRGQRELIIGDRAIGKTAIAVDCIINQKTSDIICVYVAVGQKSSTVKRVINAIQTHGAPERCIFVVASASAAPGLQWIAPFSGFTMAEYFRDRGQHALVVIDDMTKHAATHREIALLTRQPPGREAYPGDVFYVHARLLERAAKLAKAAGGGSLTALPIAELEAGNLSAYIPTNLISITDGQIVLDARLFHEGHKPAIDVGTSVSRVGGKAQAPALREASETLRLDYAQFLELEMFTRFGGVTDVQVKGKIARGQRIRAILSQPQYASLRLADEVALALALQGGLLDNLPIEDMGKFRSELPGWLDRAAAPIVDEIERTGHLDDAKNAELKTSLSALVTQLAPSPTASVPRTK